MKKPIPFGKYLLLERVNVGGMAEVFKAKAFGVEGFERLVAVKRILPSIAEDQEFITMFIDEAKIAVQLTHANVAQIFDLGKVSDSFFIAMEFVRGKDLRAIFDRVRKRGETVPVPMACYCIMKVCEGLDYAHNKKDAASRPLNLVHRDVSPQNVLISYDGEIKLIDFGIAKAANKAGKTQAGILKGKFGYMSPEQVRGLPLDRRSDVFSVGIVLYELLTGERLFVGESDFSTLEKVRNVEIMPPSTYNRKIPEELEQIVLKALAKDVDDRYQTAMDLHDDLQSFMYTSGNFFARKDLAAYMRKSFMDEITREEARDEEYRKIKAPGMGDSGLDAFDSLPPRREPKPPKPPSMAANVSKAPPPPPPPPPAPPKATLLGMGGIRGPSAPPPVPPPTAPTMSSGPELDMDWDDDELATQIYDKPGPSSPGSIPGPGDPMPPFEDSPMMSGAGTPQLGKPSHMPLLDETTKPPLPTPGHPSPFAPKSTGPKPGIPSPFDDDPFERLSSAPPSAPPAAPRLEPREATAVTRTSGQRSNAIWIGLALFLLAGLGLGGWLLLKPAEPGIIRLNTTPRDAVVLLDETPVQGTASPFVIANVEPNTVHLIEVRKHGYQTWSVQVTLVPGQQLDLPDVELEAEEGAAVASGPTGFSINSNPSGAKVFVDGNELPQRTPITVSDLTPGTHALRLEHDGHAAWETSITVAAGQVLALQPVTLGQARIAVRFLSDPSGAEVTLRRGDERRSLGDTPTRGDVDLSGGTWTVEMERAGYQTWTEELNVPPGEDAHTVEAELERTERIVSNTPIMRNTNPIMRVTPMDPIVTTMDPDPPDMDPVMVASMGGNGTLRINSRPWSQVYVDGRMIGNTPQMSIQLSAGRHRVSLVNPDFDIRKTITVNIEAGETVTRIVDLNE